MDSTHTIEGHRTKVRPIASWRHTAIVVVILLAVAAQGAAFQMAAHSTNKAPTSTRNITLYASAVVMELALVYLVWRGIKKTNTTINDLIGGRWTSARDVSIDVALGIALWIAILGLAAAWTWIVPSSGPARSISPLLPHSGIQLLLWILVSTVAGAAEEIVFRGYLQRQFEALTSGTWIALILQSLLFGVSHGYQGFDAAARITMLGMTFGLMAIWRRSLRPGIIAHVWTDIASGVMRFG